MGGVHVLDFDAELMLRVKEGDGSSFALLLDKHRNAVIHFLFRMVQDHPVAEELAQEVFLRVYRSRESYEPSAKFTTWLFRIATHLALNWLRDKKKERGQERLDDKLPDSASLQLADKKPSIEQALVYDTKLDEVRSSHRGPARKATDGRVDAQVRRVGIFADRQGPFLFGICSQVVAVPSL